MAVLCVRRDALYFDMRRPILVKPADKVIGAIS